MARRVLITVGAFAIVGTLAWALISVDLLRGSQRTVGGPERHLSDDIRSVHGLSCPSEDLNGFEIMCGWSGVVGGDEISVAAGAREEYREYGPDRYRESGVVVFNWSEDSGLMWFPAPAAVGPLEIDSVNDDVLRLTARRGSTFEFNARKLAYKKPFTQLDLEEGIFPGEYMPNMIVTTYWRRVIGGEWVDVLAGATPRQREDGTERLGTAGLWVWHQNEWRYEWHAAPGSPRALLRIDAVDGYVLTLVSSDGTALRFDVNKERYV